MAMPTNGKIAPLFICNSDDSLDLQKQTRHGKHALYAENVKQRRVIMEIKQITTESKEKKQNKCVHQWRITTYADQRKHPPVEAEAMKYMQICTHCKILNPFFEN
jgi:hypothetical protein